MDQLRLILLISISFVSLMLWEAWQKDYGPVASEQPTATAEGVATSTLPAINNAGTTDAPSISGASPLPDTETAAPIVVKTDLLELQINPIGGGIQRAALRQYTAGGDLGEEAYPLLDDSVARYFVHQSGLKATAGEGPDHYARFAATANEYNLADAESELKVDLVWQGATGIRVTRTYTFSRGSYAVEVTH
jgi:YidC/Oxa1 family membrane protein insertase